MHSVTNPHNATWTNNAKSWPNSTSNLSLKIRLLPICPVAKAHSYVQSLCYNLDESKTTFLPTELCQLNFVKWPWIEFRGWSWKLTLNVRGPSYLGLTRSISWLLMPWLLTSPGHQQPWYWLCRIGKFLSYLRKDFNYLRCINVEKWHKM